MDIYDVFEETALKAHLVLPDEGQPTWDAFPDAWGSPWMREAIREGLVATIAQAPGEAAWYFGGLTIRPQQTPTEGEGGREGFVQRRGRGQEA